MRISSGLSMALVCAAPIALASVACGGETVSSVPSSHDGGALPVPPSPSGTAPDAAPPPTSDAGSRPPKLLAPGDVYLRGVTTDGYVIYVLTAADGYHLFALPLAGGAAEDITPSFGERYTHSFKLTRVVGSAVFVQGDLEAAGKLGVWTKAAGRQVLSSTEWFTDTYPNQCVDLSPDGTQAAFWELNGSARTLVVEGVDGTNKRVVAAEPGAFAFGANGEIVVERATSVDGGSSYALSVGQPPSFAMIDVVESTKEISWKLDATGHWLTALDRVATTTDGSAIFLDPDGDADPDAAQRFFAPAGDAIFYRTTEGALRRTDIAPEAHATLAPAGSATRVLGLSPDGTSLLYVRSELPASLTADLFVVATAGGGSPVPIASKPDFDWRVPPSFTRDSRYVVYETSWYGRSPMATWAAPASGGPSVTLDDAQASPWQPLSGSRLVVLGDTIRRVDASQQTPSASLATLTMNRGAFLTPDGKRVVYADAGGAVPGLYVVDAE